MHLKGDEIIGIYPLLPDETCYFLAMDFDGDNWKADLTAIRNICDAHLIPFAAERSQSGNGAHVWIFFSEPVSAYSARRLGTGLLTAAMENHHQLRFSSYDRLFPGQDTLPKGGFGNLIALPLQAQAREIGNTVFIDESFIPYPDQWDFLSNIKRLTPADLENTIAKLCQGGDLGFLSYEDNEDSNNETPWKQAKPQAGLCRNDFPESVSIVSANMLYIGKNGLSSRALNRLKRLAVFKNPEYYRAQAMRLPIWDKSRVIDCASETERFLCLPRGCKSDVVKLLANLGISAVLRDERNPGNPINASFTGMLRDEQSEALQQLLAFDNGILSASTAFGKTVVAAALISARKTNTLILVNRRPLLDQWLSRLREFIDIRDEVSVHAEQSIKGRRKKGNVIGVIGGGKKNPSSIIDVAIIQSLVRDGEVKDLVRNYGMVIVDECHHVAAYSFEKVLKHVSAKYVYGLTATPKRQDGHQPIITMQCGPILYKDDARLQALRRPFEHFIIPRFTSFRIPPEMETKEGSTPSIAELYNALGGSLTRNSMIVSDILDVVAEGRNPLVLTERKAHVELLCSLLKEKAANIFPMSGDMTAKQRREMMDAIDSVPADQPFIIISTGRYIGEGFDTPRLDTLFLAMPIAWAGTLAQYAGRLHRLHETKHEVRIYDYIDVRVAVLDKMYAKRVKGYAAIGYRVKETSSLSVADSILYDGSSFLSAFYHDLQFAQKEIVIVSPYLTKRRVESLLPVLTDIVARNVEIVVVTRSRDDYSPKEQERIIPAIDSICRAGINVRERSMIHQKFTIVDGQITWYGSINFLSFGRAEESIMRLESKNISEELLRTIEEEPRQLKLQ